jgi:AraC family transcriptional regulator
MGTPMDEMENRYRRQIQSSLDFIEERLKQDFSLQEVASKANASLYHFHRLFRAFTGYSLAEYIRERRLESAAWDLARSDRAVIAIALDHGYSSPEAFLRAFKAKYSMTPREFRRRWGGAIGRGRIDLFDPAFMRKKGSVHMQPKIIETEGFSIQGGASTGKRGSCESDVPAFWATYRKKAAGKAIDLYGVCSGYRRGVCAGHSGGACGEDARKGEEYSYVIGEKRAESDADTADSRVPGGLYAVFGVPEDLAGYNGALDRIYTEWLPSSGYDLADSPVVERHSRGADGDNPVTEIWLPLTQAAAR